jgi:hypothetical protein
LRRPAGPRIGIASGCTFDSRQHTLLAVKTLGDLEVSEVRRLRSLEDENRRLKKPLAETMLDNSALKDNATKRMMTSAAWRAAVAHPGSTHRVSQCQRQACRAIGVERTVVIRRAILTP